MVRASGDSVGGDFEPIEVGRYHVSVAKCEEYTAKTTGNVGLECEFEILAGDKPHQEGKVLKFAKLFGAKIFALAAAVGATDHISGETFTPEKLQSMRDAKKAGQPVEDCDFDPAEFEGRQLCVEVVLGQEVSEGKNKGKRYPEVGFGIWPVTAKEAADIPKDADSLALLGIDVGEVTVAAEQPAAATTTKAARASGANGGTGNGNTATTAKPAGKFGSLR